MTSRSIIFLSTYPPRECGIATFTKALSSSIQKKFGNHLSVRVVSMEENPSNLRVYSRKVFFSINQDDLGSYEDAAAKINSIRSAEVLNVQHEFGIFGGNYGHNILRLMELVDKKIVTTFHTVLEKPEPEMRLTVQEIAEKSEKIVVMTEKARSILAAEYNIPVEKICIIPHGVPNVALEKREAMLKKKYGLDGCAVLLTFGLLSRGKGLEKIINAMPSIVGAHSNAVFLVAGETHPRVREKEGESYRLELKELARNLGVENSVKFLDKYLSLREIIECLKMADVYLAPSTDPHQICSGTVSYAMSAGKAIIASPNKYNEEVLGDSKGLIVKSNGPEEFAEMVKMLLDDPALVRELERRAFEYSRSMTWQNVSTSYCNIFSSLSQQHDGDEFSRLPPINFRHFYNLTDNFGMLQFCDYSTPLRESGYTLDDNARALSVALKAYELGGSARMLGMVERFLSFVEFCQNPDGTFHNFVSGGREFLDDVGSEDSFGRAVHALGNVLQSSLPEEYKMRTKKVLDKSLCEGNEVSSPRAQAESLIGLLHAKQVIPFVEERIVKVADSLLSKFDANSDSEWRWFERYLTYRNSVIPEALFESVSQTGGGRALHVAQASMDFLTKTHFIGGKLVPIGQEGWYIQGEERALYDQQPIEAAGMTVAYLKAFRATAEHNYVRLARKSFEWFLGKNIHHQMVYDDSTGGCFDGLTPTGVNLNQGAESTVVYLNARLLIRRILGC